MYQLAVDQHGGGGATHYDTVHTSFHRNWRVGRAGCQVKQCYSMAAFQLARIFTPHGLSHHSLFHRLPPIRSPASPGAFRMIETSTSLYLTTTSSDEQTLFTTLVHDLTLKKWCLPTRCWSRPIFRRFTRPLDQELILPSHLRLLCTRC